MNSKIAALIRHAEYTQLANTPSAHQPFDLTSKGVQQARNCGIDVALKAQQNNWKIQTHINCSELLRAWQTAQAIAQQLPGEYQIDSYPALAERSVGCAANLSISQIEQVVNRDPRCGPLPKNWKSDSHFRLPLAGAESLTDAGQRVAKHLEASMQSLNESKTKDVVKIFVGHGAALRHAAWHIGVLKFEDIAHLSMYHAQAIYLEWLGPGQWRHIGGQWKARNRTSVPPD